MYPLREDELSFRECAHHWARFIPGNPEEDEVSALLLKAVLRSELPVYARGDPARRFSRGKLLEALASASGTETCGVLICEPGSAPATIEEYPDGSISVDVRIVVEARRPLTDRDGAELDETADQLKRVAWEDLPRSFIAATWMLRIRKDDFGRYCDANGLGRPAFWFTAGEQRRRPAQRAEALQACRLWLEDLVRRPKQGSKEKIFELAIRRFHGLNRAGFDRAWSDVVPPAWARQRARKA